MPYYVLEVDKGSRADCYGTEDANLAQAEMEASGGVVYKFEDFDAALDRFGSVGIEELTPTPTEPATDK